MSQGLLKNFLIDVDSVYHKEAKTFKFHHFLVNYRETSQGRLKRRLQGDLRRTFPGLQFEHTLQNTLLLYYFWLNFTKSDT